MKDYIDNHEHSEGIISKRINRKFSVPIARFLAKYDLLTPNQVSFLAFLISIASSICYFLFLAPLGGLLAQISSIIDGADGDLAKISKRISKYGGYLDSILDRYADVMIIIGMTYYSVFLEGFSLGFYIGIFAIVGSIMPSYSSLRAQLSFNKEIKEKYLQYFTSRDFRLFIIFVGSIFTLVYANSITIVLLFLAIVLNIIMIKRLFYKGD